MRRYDFMRGLSAALAIAMSMTSAPLSVQAASTRLSVTKMVLSKGDKFDLNVIGAKEKTGTYTSSNKKIAIVTKNGGVTAKKLGKAKITWKKGSKKYICNLTVVKAPTVSDASLTLKVGESSKKITVKKQGNKNLKVKWSSANTEIAAIKNGVITGVSDGITTVTAKIKGNTKTYKRKIAVTITKENENIDNTNTTPVENIKTKTITEAGNLENGTYEIVNITSNVPANGVVNLGKSKIGKLIIESGEEYSVDAKEAEISEIEVVEKLAVTASARRIRETPTLILGDNKNAENMNIVINSNCYISGTASLNSITVQSSASVYVEMPVSIVNVDANNAKVSLNGAVTALNISGENTELAVNAEVKKAVISGENNNVVVSDQASITETTVLAAKTVIEGNGKIESLTIEAEGAVIKTAVERAIVSEKIENAIIGEKVVEGGKEVENVPAVSGQTNKNVVETVEVSDNSNTSNTDTNTNNTNVNTGTISGGISGTTGGNTGNNNPDGTTGGDTGNNNPGGTTGGNTGNNNPGGTTGGDIGDDNPGGTTGGDTGDDNPGGTTETPQEHNAQDVAALQALY